MEQNRFFEKKSMPGVDVVVVEETLDELEMQSQLSRGIYYLEHTVQVVYPCCMSPSLMKLFRRIQKL